MLRRINVKNLALAGVMFATGSTFWFPAEVHAVSGTRLGDISVSSACYRQYGWSDVELIPPRDVMSWKCRFRGTNGVIYKGVNLDKYYCKRNWPGSHADYTDFSNGYTWGCYK